MKEVSLATRVNSNWTQPDRE